MTIPAPRNYSITLEQTANTGSVWLVRVYKKRLLWKKRVSSDWFLDADQARKFAEQLASELGGDGGIRNLSNRKPGWVLYRAPH
jgi:hypothetical protein